MRITPNEIVSLPESFIFVFGSNIAGRHRRKAARLAREKFGALEGVGFGLSGRSFAIPIEDEHRNLLTIAQIANHVNSFLHFTKWQRPDLNYYVTKIGCGHSDYTPKEIAPLFTEAITMENIYLPVEFWEVIYG